LEAVIDANVFFRILISEGDIVEIVFNPSLKLLAPERLKEEFLKHKEEMIKKTAFSRTEFDIVSRILLNRVEFAPIDEYKDYILKAKELLKGHDKDEDFLALCLAKGCKLWTYEARFFKSGHAISTKEISDALGK
jgi:predicted nucleic acid-binding protein